MNPKSRHVAFLAQSTHHLVSFTLETVTMVGRSLLLLGAVFP